MLAAKKHFKGVLILTCRHIVAQKPCIINKLVFWTSLSFGKTDTQRQFFTLVLLSFTERKIIKIIK